MSRKSEISLSNRALFYQSRKGTLQQDKELHESEKGLQRKSKASSLRSLDLSLSQNVSYLERLFAREVSVPWIKKLRTRFSPFALIFGTTFLFAGLATTLQKQDGDQWLRIFSYKNLPGITENQGRQIQTQKSSWVFLENILSQYINRDNSLLITTTCLPEEIAYYTQLSKQETVPRGRNLQQVKKKPSFTSFPRALHCSATLSKQDTVSPSVESFASRDVGITRTKPSRFSSSSWNLRLPKALRIQLSPLWNQHIKKDFSGVFLSVSPVTGTPNVDVALPRSPHKIQVGQEKEKPVEAVIAGKGELPYRMEVPEVALGKSDPLPDQINEKSLIWPWYQIMAYHSPSRVILPTWTDHNKSALLRAPKVDQYNTWNKATPLDSSSTYNTSVERLRLEDDSIPSKKGSAYSLQKSDPTLDRATVRMVGAMNELFYKYGKTSPEDLEPFLLRLNKIKAKKTRLAELLEEAEKLPPGTESPILLELEELELELELESKAKAKGWISSDSDEEEGGNSVAEQSVRILTDLVSDSVSGSDSVSDSDSGSGSDSVSDSGSDSDEKQKDKIRMPTNKKGVLGERGLFGRLLGNRFSKLENAKYRRTSWLTTYSHVLSGYHFPELQDHEVSELFRKVKPPYQSEATQKQKKIALFAWINQNHTRRVSIDTNQVFLTPYLAKVPPKISMTASNKTRFFGSLDLSLKLPKTEKLPITQKVSSFHFEKDLKKEYTLIEVDQVEVDQENKVKKAFKEVGRDYSRYLKQPKESLEALLLSPSLEDDKKIAKEESDRLLKIQLEDLGFEMEEIPELLALSEKEVTTSKGDDNQDHESFLELKKVLLLEQDEQVIEAEDKDEDEDLSISQYLSSIRKFDDKKAEKDCRGVAICKIQPKAKVEHLKLRSKKDTFNGSVHTQPSLTDDEGTPNKDKGSNRKHSFFGQKIYSPTLGFAQEERLLSAHIVNPSIRYDQNNPWLLPEEEAVSEQTKWLDNSTFAHRVSEVSPLLLVRVPGEELVSGTSQTKLLSGIPKEVDDLQNLKNLKTEARLRLIEFLDSPRIDSAAVSVARSKANLYLPATFTTGNQNRIYKVDPFFRLMAPPEISPDAPFSDTNEQNPDYAEYLMHNRKGNVIISPSFSKKCPQILLPQLSESEWQKSIEWQLRSHFFDEDIRLEPLISTKPFTSLKLKRIERSLPWLRLDEQERTSRQQNLRLCSGRGLFQRQSQRKTERSFTLLRSTLPKYSRAPLANTFTFSLANNFATYSKDRSPLSLTLNKDLGLKGELINTILSIQNDLNSSRGTPFEAASISSGLLILRLFLDFTFKEGFKYIYRISLNGLFIKFLNSDFGRAVSSVEYRKSLEFNPLPLFFKPKKRLKDIVGIKSALVPLTEIIWFLRNNCRDRSGPRGVILLGPDGVDIPSIAQAVAGEAKVPIIVQSLRALTFTRGHPQKLLDKILRLARAQSPCVLFLDELDSIGQLREEVTTNLMVDRNSLLSLNSNQKIKNKKRDGQPQSQLSSPDGRGIIDGRSVDIMLRLLTVIDGLQDLKNVVVITTSKTNSTLDPALLRPGRFDRVIHLTLPNHENRIELFKAKTRELGHTHKMPWEYLSVRTANMGGADIVAAINYSVLRAIVNDTVHTVETLEYGLNCVLSKKSRVLQKRKKKAL
jgi:AAA+ superfamily predicted ATPase